MRVAESIEVAAPPEVVWEVISDPTRYLHFMSGITRWEVVGDEPSGLGARYRMLMRVGVGRGRRPDRGRRVATSARDGLDSVTGIDQRGRWRLRERRRGGAHARVELRLTYGVAGVGHLRLARRAFAAPTVRGHLRRSLQQLKRQVEHEELRGPRGRPAPRPGRRH